MRTKSELLVSFLILAILIIACESSDAERDQINEPIEEVIPKASDSDALIGLAAVTKNWQDTEKSWNEFFADTVKLNAEIIAGCNGQWKELEPTKGNYDWSSMERFFSAMERSGKTFKFSCDFPGIFFHERKDQIPDDVQSLKINAPELYERYEALLDSYLERFGKRTNYLVIHAEGSYNFFKDDVKKVREYAAFLSKVRNRIKKRYPEILFGVNIDPHNKDETLNEINKVVDFMAYDVMKIEGHLERPSDIEKVTKRLIKLSKGKRIAFQNAGWSTSKVENGSDEQQLEFVKELFKVLEKNRKNFEYANFYCLYDEDLEFMKKVYKAMFPDYPEDFVEKMVLANGRTGLFRENGEAKPAYSEFKNKIKNYIAKTK